MRRRIYWLLPDLASARRAMNDLLLARIDESHIHFVARENADVSDLHAANLLQTSDVVRAAQSGLVIGGLAGLATGVIVAMFPIIGDTPQWGMVGVMGFFGALLGAWSSSMIGCSTPSSRLKRFEASIERGRLLLMVDVPRSRVQEIEAMLQAEHPEAHFEGIEPGIPAFP
ncbi:MAG: DUF1269 domain-containing protein [Leptothrix sp. (in: b-proteobacteria)]